jgi:hypothetical protein
MSLDESRPMSCLSAHSSGSADKNPRGYRFVGDLIGYNCSKKYPH